MVQKYNPITKEYEAYCLPDGAVLIANNGEKIKCAGCGEEFNYDESYTSREIHNEFGLGYCVCRKCYAKELTNAGFDSVGLLKDIVK